VLAASRVPNASPRPEGLRRIAATVAALFLLASVIGLQRLPARGASAPLRYLGGQVKTLDPARISDAGDVQLLLQLYAGLTRLDEEGRVYPSLASSWDVSDGGRTYAFHLRANLRFSDGSTLDANDVRRSWLRLLDPDVHATAPDVLNVIVGASDRASGKGSESAVGIVAPDPNTLVVHLRHPAGYFTSIIATPATFVVPRSAAPSGTWQTPDHFIGSGPYVVSSLSGTTLALKANPRYVGAPPPIAELDWITHIEGDEVTAYANGELDLVQIGGGDATWIAYDRDLGRALHQAAALSVEYLGFDTTRRPFNDARVRRAFAQVLDIPRLVGLAAGQTAEPATSIVPPALQPPGLSTATAPQPAQANQLLDDAGFSDRGKLGTITVTVPTFFDPGPIAATWRKQLGVTVHVESMDFSDYIDALDGGRIPQVFAINWIADYPSPHALYDLLLAPGARSNYGHWEDPRFVQLLDTAAEAADPQAQAVAYRAVEAEVDDQAPLIPWSFDESSWLVRPGLQGLGTLTIGLLDFGLVSRG
jgi:oligopeptide transport system substrate-binding protein